MNLRIIDAHCDLLSKMYLDPKVEFDNEHPLTEVSYSRMVDANIALQFFAIYMPEEMKRVTFEHVVEYIDMYYEKIQSHPHMCFIRSREDLIRVQKGERIGGLLSMEGVEGLMGNMSFLRAAFRLGVRVVGITWNHANWAADGIAEPRKGGFTALGKKMVKECNRLGMLMDVSHLSERGFWELVDWSEQPFIASHSNAFEICAHARNLSNGQIRAILQKEGRIGLTFVPWFIKQSSATIGDLFHHIDHICSLGGERYIGFGSDFDGVGAWLPGLEHQGHYQLFVNELLKRYSQDQVERFLFQNWYDFLAENLPVTANTIKPNIPNGDANGND